LSMRPQTRPTSNQRKEGKSTAEGPFAFLEIPKGYAKVPSLRASIFTTYRLRSNLLCIPQSTHSPSSTLYDA
jgi:hypothetical protein